MVAIRFPVCNTCNCRNVGEFAASKIKAAQLAKQTGGTGGTETYGDGTVELLEGGSHQSGNDIDLGTNRTEPADVPREANFRRDK